MPCGGVYPISEGSHCWMGHFAGSNTCDKSSEGPWSWVEEWDCEIHDRCIDEFLKTWEGKVVLQHKHKIERRWGIILDEAS